MDNTSQLDKQNLHRHANVPNTKHIGFARVGGVELMDLIPDAVLALSEQGTILDCNVAAIALFRCARGDLLGTAAQQWLPAIDMMQDAPESSAPMPLPGDWGSNPAAIQISRCHDGSTVPVLVRTNPLVIGHDMTRIVVIRDQSNIQWLRKELIKRDALMEQTSSPLLIQDPEGRIEAVNPAFESVFGYKADEVVGRSPRELIYGEETNLDALRSAQEAVMCGGHVQHDEVFYNKDGQPKWIACEQHAVLGELGDVAHMVTTGVDVTERHLEGQRKTDFISMVGHELRTPLTVVSGSLELIEDGRYGEIHDAVAHLVKLARTNCSRLNELIGDLLDINKMEAGLMSFKHDILNSDSVIAEAIESMQQAADAKHIVLRQTMSQTEPLVTADQARLIQILLNLISNAIKYTDDGGKVTVSSEIIDDVVRLSVSDNGRGIDPAFHPSVFSKFAREPTAEASGVEGFGLGLSICKGLIEKMGGRIDFASELGRGSSFFVELPLASHRG